MTIETQDPELSGPIQATLEQLDESTTIYVSAGVQVPGDSSGTHSMLEPDATPEQVAGALLRCVRGAALLHGPDTYAALQAGMVA